MTQVTAFLEGASTLFRLHVDFLLSEFKDEAELSSRAATVMVWRDGRFSSVRELVDGCASHRWNKLVYEAWRWETAQRVHSLMRMLDVTSARALRIYAQRLDYYELDAREMQAALDDARQAIEG